MTNRLANLQPIPVEVVRARKPQRSLWAAWLSLAVTAAVGYGGYWVLAWLVLSTPGQKYVWQEYVAAAFIGGGATIAVLMAFVPPLARSLKGTFAFVRVLVATASAGIYLVLALVVGLWFLIVVGVGLYLFQGGVRGLLFGPTIERIAGGPLVLISILFWIHGRKVFRFIRGMTGSSSTPAEPSVTHWDN